MAARQPLRRPAARQVVGDLPRPSAQPARRAHRSEQPDPPPGAGNLPRRARPDHRRPRRALSHRSPREPPSRATTSRKTAPPTNGKAHRLQRPGRSAARPVGSRTSGAASAAPSRPPAPTPRPAPPTRPTSTSAFTPRWPPTTCNCAAWTPRSGCWPPPSPTSRISST